MWFAVEHEGTVLLLNKHTAYEATSTAAKLFPSHPAQQDCQVKMLGEKLVFEEDYAKKYLSPKRKARK